MSLIKILAIALMSAVFASLIDGCASAAQQEETTIEFHVACENGKLTGMVVSADGPGVGIVPIKQLIEKCAELHDKNST